MVWSFSMVNDTVTMKEFRELTKDVPDDYSVFFMLNQSCYSLDGFEVNIPEKKIILK